MTIVLYNPEQDCIGLWVAKKNRIYVVLNNPLEDDETQIAPLISSWVALGWQVIGEL